jgi:hypothetical protein
MMRGRIETYDARDGRGTIRASDGRTFEFATRHLIARSKAPREEALIVFRLKNGGVFKATVVAYKQQWDWLSCIVEMLLYFPQAMAE